MVSLRVKDINNLLLIIGAGVDPAVLVTDTVVLDLFLVWDGRHVLANHYKGIAEPDIASRLGFIGTEELKPSVEALLESGKDFVTRTGDGGEQCTLHWYIPEWAPKKG